MRGSWNIIGHLVWGIGLLSNLVEAFYESQEQEKVTEWDGTRAISDFIREPDYTLSLSKDWALKFDEEIGRGDYLTVDKQMEIHNNLLEVAEILHIIPEGSASRYSDLLLREGATDKATGAETTEISKLLEYHSELSVDIETLRRHGITAMTRPTDKPLQNVGGNSSKTITKEAPASTPEDNANRKFSPKLQAMYSKSQSKKQKLQ